MTLIQKHMNLGETLRQWWRIRPISQLDLALEEDISPRHLSFIASGRSQLSRDGRAYRFFSTITSFGTALDASVQELRLEGLFPSDETTQQAYAA